MTLVDADIEQRVFELLGERVSTPFIAAKLGMTSEQALPIVLKVIEERGTPGLAEIRRMIDRLYEINFV